MSLNPVTVPSAPAWSLSWRDAIVERQGCNDLIRPVDHVNAREGGPARPEGEVAVTFRDGKVEIMPWNKNVGVYRHEYQNGD